MDIVVRKNRPQNGINRHKPFIAPKEPRSMRWKLIVNWYFSLGMKQFAKGICKSFEVARKLLFDGY